MEAGSNGRQKSYLPELEKDMFEKLIIDCAQDNDCITTCTGMSITKELSTRRIKKAKQILSLQCNILSLGIECISNPDKSWLEKFVKGFGIRVVSAQCLEEIRRKSCDIFVIGLFLICILCFLIETQD